MARDAAAISQDLVVDTSRTKRFQAALSVAASLVLLGGVPPVGPVAAASSATGTSPGGFRSLIRPLTSAERAAMTGPVWRPGCPVGLDDLRAVEVTHYDFAGAVTGGIVVMHRNAAKVVVNAFAAAFEARIPIAKVRPIEAYGGDDDASTQDDNTAGFNCRPVEVTGSNRWSQHAYGKAIDINPVENPYVYADGRTLDPAAQRFADRRLREPGMLRAGDPIEQVFRRAGWGWGGRWTRTKDFQHFSSNGR